MNNPEHLSLKSPLRVVGLMTGTSMDGLDVCIADISLSPDSVDFDIIHFSTLPFESKMRSRISQVLSGSTNLVCSLNYDLGKWLASGVQKVLIENHITGVDLVGCHGQTIHHRSGHSTMQIGEPSFLAETLGVPVISDFRARDISVGGTGAPLIPRIDEWLFRDENKARIVLNIGGIANVTFLPPIGDDPVLGFDTGPGMALLDEAYLKHFGFGFDTEGSRASQGSANELLVDSWLQDEFIQQELPKSTGRERFGRRWLETHENELSKLTIEDQLATLSLFTAASIHFNCKNFIKRFEVENIIVSGGGTWHTRLMKQLQDLFSPTAIKTSADFGVDVDGKEALGLAILAAAYIKGIPGNLPSVTGADHTVILGKLTV